MGLAGASVAPDTWLATVPPSVQMIAGIGVATPISLFMGRRGRRAGFLLSALFVVIGGIAGAAALYTHKFLALCAAHVLLGAALTGINYLRFAAAEAAPEGHKAKAISLTLASGLIAAFAGAELFTYAKEAMAPISFARAYVSITVLGMIGMIPISALKRPAPAQPKVASARRDGWRILRSNPQVAAAIGVAAVSQAMMVLLMTPTPLAMVACGFGENVSADVIRWHVVAMFAPGLVTGSLIQRFGSSRIAYLGFTILIGAAILALAGLTLTNFYGALILLGIGWNFGFIGGTHMLQAALKEEERPLIERHDPRDLRLCRLPDVRCAVCRAWLDRPCDPIDPNSHHCEVDRLPHVIIRDSQCDLNAQKRHRRSNKPNMSHAQMTISAHETHHFLRRPLYVRIAFAAIFGRRWPS